ncbi:MAG: ParB/RepB/Spo0J family partition protein [Campylobacterota bacterium]|nr:ParB/RepB/Spo0J family partition protein [Campylobacterota bacterium]
MALGKGLGAILEEVGQVYEEQMEESQALNRETLIDQMEELNIDKIVPNPYQPRKHFDEQALQELSESIVAHGLLQPIVVIEKEDGYLLIAGERRLRAHRLAKIDKIKAIVADVDIDSVKLRELALMENIQREDLNAIELAHSYAELIEVHNITHEELSVVIHKSRPQITNTMRLLSLSDYVQKKMLEGKISQGHAKILVGLEVEKQKLIADTIVGQKLSVREAEKIVKQYKHKKKKSSKVSAADSAWIEEYRSDLAKILPFKHSIKSNKLEILFEDETQLQFFMEIIKKS